MKWVVNTREDGEMSAHDSLKIRTAATLAGIPVTTTLAGFAAAVAGLSDENSGHAIYSLQEYQRQS